MPLTKRPGNLENVRNWTGFSEGEPIPPLLLPNCLIHREPNPWNISHFRARWPSGPSTKSKPGLVENSGLDTSQSEGIADHRH